MNAKIFLLIYVAIFLINVVSFIFSALAGNWFGVAINLFFAILFGYLAFKLYEREYRYYTSDKFRTWSSYDPKDYK